MVIAATGRLRGSLRRRARHAGETFARVGFSLFALQLVVGANATDIHRLQAEALLYDRHSGHRPGELLAPKALLSPRGSKAAAFLELSLHSSLDDERSFVQDQLLQVDHQEEEDEGRSEIDITCHFPSSIEHCDY